MRTPGTPVSQPSPPETRDERTTVEKTRVQDGGTAAETPRSGAEPSEARRPDLDVRHRRSNSGRVIAVLALLVVVLLAFVVARSGLSEWWARRVSEASDGQFSTAVPLGFGIGLGCTAIVMLSLREVLRRSRSWTPSFVLAVVAVIFATPLVLTLLTVLDNSESAQEASQRLAEEAPGFTTSTLVGAIVGAVLVSGFWLLTRSRHKLQAEIADLRHRLAVLEAVAMEKQGPGKHTKAAAPEAPGAPEAPEAPEASEATTDKRDAAPTA